APQRGLAGPRRAPVSVDILPEPPRTGQTYPAAGFHAGWSGATLCLSRPIRDRARRPAYCRRGNLDQWPGASGGRPARGPAGAGGAGWRGWARSSETRARMWYRGGAVMAPPVQRLEHWTLVTSDVARSKQFYVEVLGAEAQPREWPPAVEFAGTTIDLFAAND